MVENLFVKKILYKICSPVWTQYVISTNKRNGILTDHLLLIEASYYFEIQIHIQIHILFSKISRFVTSPQSWFLEYQHIKIRRTNVCWGARFLNPFFFSKQLVKVQKKGLEKKWFQTNAWPYLCFQGFCIIPYCNFNSPILVSFDIQIENDKKILLWLSFLIGTLELAKQY